MKSPFPGMDPYLEQHWQDVHARLILYACDLLEDQLPSSLIARVEERVVLELEGIDERSIYRDVKILDRPSRRTAAADAGRASAVAEPVIVQYHDEPGHGNLH